MLLDRDTSTIGPLSLTRVSEKALEVNDEAFITDTRTEDQIFLVASISGCRDDAFHFQNKLNGWREE